MNKYLDSVDGTGRRDFFRSMKLNVTFGPSMNMQERSVMIPLNNDDYNEDTEAFIVLVDVDELNIPEEVIQLDKPITLVNIRDNDRKWVKKVKLILLIDNNFLL